MTPRQSTQLFKELRREGRDTLSHGQDYWEAYLDSMRFRYHNQEERIAEVNLAETEGYVPDPGTLYAWRKLRERAATRSQRLDDALETIGATKGWTLEETKNKFKEIYDTVPLRGETPEEFTRGNVATARREGLPYDRATVVAIEKLRNTEVERIRRVERGDLAISNGPFSEAGWSEGRLEVSFYNAPDRVYAYHNVPENLWQRMNTATNPASIYNSEIRGNPAYRYETAEDSEADAHRVRCAGCGQFVSAINGDHICPEAVAADEVEVAAANATAEAEAEEEAQYREAQVEEGAQTEAEVEEVQVEAEAEEEVQAEVEETQAETEDTTSTDEAEETTPSDETETSIEGETLESLTVNEEDTAESTTTEATSQEPSEAEEAPNPLDIEGIRSQLTPAPVEEGIDCPEPALLEVSDFAVDIQALLEGTGEYEGGAEYSLSERRRYAPRADTFIDARTGETYTYEEAYDRYGFHDWRSNPVLIEPVNGDPTLPVYVLGADSEEAGFVTVLQNPETASSLQVGRWLDFVRAADRFSRFSHLGRRGYFAKVFGVDESSVDIEAIDRLSEIPTWRDGRTEEQTSQLASDLSSVIPIRDGIAVAYATSPSRSLRVNPETRTLYREPWHRRREILISAQEAAQEEDEVWRAAAERNEAALIPARATRSRMTAPVDSVDGSLDSVSWAPVREMRAAMNEGKTVVSSVDWTFNGSERNTVEAAQGDDFGNRLPPPGRPRGAPSVTGTLAISRGADGVMTVVSNPRSLRCDCHDYRERYRCQHIDYVQNHAARYAQQQYIGGTSITDSGTPERTRRAASARVRVETPLGNIPQGLLNDGNVSVLEADEETGAPARLRLAESRTGTSRNADRMIGLVSTANVRELRGEEGSRSAFEQSMVFDVTGRPSMRSGRHMPTASRINRALRYGPAEIPIQYETPIVSHYTNNMTIEQLRSIVPDLDERVDAAIDRITEQNPDYVLTPEVREELRGELRTLATGTGTRLVANHSTATRTRNWVTGSILVERDEEGDIRLHSTHGSRNLQCSCLVYRRNYSCVHVRAARGFNYNALVMNPEERSAAELAVVDQISDDEGVSQALNRGITSPNWEEIAAHSRVTYEEVVAEGRAIRGEDSEDYDPPSFSEFVGNEIFNEESLTYNGGYLTRNLLASAARARAESEERERRERLRQAEINAQANYQERREAIAEKWQTVDTNYTEDQDKFYEHFNGALKDRKQGREVIEFKTEDVTDGICADVPGGRGFGVELEFTLPSSGRSEALRKIGRDLYDAGLTGSAQMQGYHSGASSGYSKWTLESDSTVDGELVSPILRDTPEDWEQLRQAVEIIKRHGGQASTRAGSHVNISTGSYGDSAAKHIELARTMKANEDVMFRLASNPARGRHRGTSWCPPNVLSERIAQSEFTKEGDLNEDEYSSRMGGYGYSGVNSSSLGGRAAMNFSHSGNPRSTISSRVEFRMWDATLDPAVIQQQVAISAAMVEFADRKIESGEASKPRDTSGAALGSKKRAARERGDVADRKESKDKDEVWADSEGAAKFIQKLFRRDEDRKQATALFAITNWQEQ